MKKIFSMFFAAFFAVVMMAGGAMAAANIDNDVAVGADDFDDVVIAQEMCSATLKLAKDFESGNVGDDTTADKYIAGGAARDLYYSANLGLNLDWTLKFELTNAIFNNATMALLYNEATAGNADLNGDADAVDLIKVGQLISGGEGESQATFIVTGYDIPADSVLTISSADGAETSLAILSEATSGTITLALTEAKTDGGTPIDAAEADAVTIVTFEAQLAMVVTTAATSVIDVGTDRLEFLDETSGADDAEQAANEDTEPTMSAALLTLDNDSDATIDDTITLDADDTITITLTSSTDLDGVTTDGIYYNIDDGNVADGDNDVDERLTIGATSATATFTLNAAGADIAPNIDCDAGATDEKKLVIIVDGTTILDSRTFNVTVSLDLDDEPGAKTLVNDQLCHMWTINGWQGTVPYMYAAETQSEDTFIKIFNDSNLDADFSVDVTSDDGTTATTVTLTQIPAGTVGIYWANDIATAAGLTPPISFAATFTVNAPTGNVTAMANQKRPGGVDRVIPIYHDVANYKTY